MSIELELLELPLRTRETECEVHACGSRTGGRGVLVIFCFVVARAECDHNVLHENVTNAQSSHKNILMQSPQPLSLSALQVG